MKVTFQDHQFSTPFIVGGINFDDVIDKIYSYSFEPFYCQGFTSYKIKLNGEIVYDEFSGINCVKEFKERLSQQ
jgi:hypothetical protein